MTTAEGTRARGELRKGVSLFGIVALGAGTAIGVAIFSVIAPGAALAGPAMLLSLVLAGVPMLLFAVTYAFMGSAVPVSGASYEWSRRFIHPFAGFIVGWLRIAGSTAALIVLSLVLVRYWSMAAALPVKPAMFVVLAVFYLLNLLGVTLAARGQGVMVLVLLVTCALLVAFAIPVSAPANFTPFLEKGWGGVAAAVPLMVSLFLGIETATEVGEEVKDGHRTIPLGIALSIVVTTAIYLLVTAASIGALGAARLGASDAPLLEVATEGMGRFGMPLILTAATVALGSSLNAIFMIFSRSLFAMGRSGILPAALARIHPRRGTPHVAITAAFGMCCLGLALPSSLIFLFLAVNIPTLLKYGATCIAATRVVAHHAEVYGNAAFKLRPAVISIWAYAGAACALGVILLGLTADWRPYAALGAWTIAGIAWYLLRNQPARSG
ncbi:MAG: APC family permease [Woeseiaceae bacterium]